MVNCGLWPESAIRHPGSLSPGSPYIREDSIACIAGAMTAILRSAITARNYSMSDTPIPLILDFLEWIAARPRPYSEVMDAWRTSCPRLTVWEDALDRGFIVRRPDAGQEPEIDLTPSGRSFLEESGRLQSVG